jgi:putative transposase
MSMQGGLSIERMCRLADVSRGGFYRSSEHKGPPQDEMELKAAVQEIVLEHRQRYGYRRVAAELRRRGIIANHKRIARIMQEDNLLNVQPLFDPRNQNPGERFEVYLNLAARIKVTGVNQLWVADVFGRNNSSVRTLGSKTFPTRSKNNGGNLRNSSPIPATAMRSALRHSVMS